MELIVDRNCSCIHIARENLVYYVLLLLLSNSPFCELQREMRYRGIFVISGNSMYKEETPGDLTLRNIFHHCHYYASTEY